MNGRSHARALAVLAAGALTVGLSATAASATAASPTRPSLARRQAAHQAGCTLGPNHSIHHVIYIQFDNVHFRRDDPRVPSDLEQMPNLLHFITGHGTLITHEHTPLIAHTADDIVTSESGLYGSDQGMPIANEYNYYKPNGVTDTAGSFAYWTDPIVDYDTGLAAKPVGDHTPTLIGANGKNAPAPWASYTRAGCNFGTVAGADTELENTLPDVPHVFGAHSPEAKLAENPSSKSQAEATGDFMGLAVHCARAAQACAHGSRPDLLPGEPDGYRGYRALYGSRFIQPVISPSGPVRSLNGTVIKDSVGQPGFPGYDGMTATNGLAYTLDMQLHGVSVTDTYLSDVHDSSTAGTPFGPGQPGYEQQLHQYNTAFGQFFRALAAHGITRANTLFVITADEGDHFVGSAPAPANCDGVKVACQYKKIGEVDGNLTGLLASKGIHTPFDVSADSAPVIYVHGQPGRATTAVRDMERAAARLKGNDVATGQTQPLTRYLADPVELRILHMVTADPRRTPTFVLFGNDNFWLQSGSAACGKTCFTEPAGGDAWNHGTVAPQINTTFLGLVGPGVAHRGVDNSTWSDHTSIQPTMMALLRLRDDYTPDGRVLGEVFQPSALPAGMRSHRAEVTRLGQLYTQLEAPVGSFGLDTLTASTRALASDSARDRTYAKLEAELAKLGRQRDAVAARMHALLLAAAFDGRTLNPGRGAALIRAGERLLAAARALAS